MKMYMKTFFALALAMAIAITLTYTTIKGGDKELPATVAEVHNFDNSITTTEGVDATDTTTPVKRVSRFLAQEINPRPKYHCNKDYDVCYEKGSPGTTCCNNKCIDIMTDNKNCGACKKKCNYTQACCNGQCVYLSFDKRHCGNCGTKCMTGGYCIYGMCDYA